VAQGIGVERIFIPLGNKVGLMCNQSADRAMSARRSVGFRTSNCSVRWRLQPAVALQLHMSRSLYSFPLHALCTVFRHMMHHPG